MDCETGWETVAEFEQGHMTAAAAQQRSSSEAATTSPNFILFGNTDPDFGCIM